MSKIIVCIGLPGSGKTTWANQYVEDNPGTIIVCRDDIREELGITKWSREQEKKVVEIQEERIVGAIEFLQKDVIVADTNLSQKTRDRIYNLVSKLDVEIEYKDFRHVPPSVCIERDAARPKPVGSKVINKMYAEHISKQKVAKVVYNPSLPYDAIICDIDGTLAHMVDRGPFDWDKVGQDEPNWHVWNVIKALRDTDENGLDRRELVFMSGRDSICGKATNDWLLKHFGQYNHRLLMRPNGDTRPDVEVKFELYEKHIKGKYNVLAVFDDRLSVCRMWYELGLPLFRVGDPEVVF